MEPVIVWTNPALVDKGLTSAFTLDMECSDKYEGQNDFECTLPIELRLLANSAVYLEGTGFGGLIQGRSSDTTLDGVLGWHGRTWQGVLYDRVLKPPAGQAYRTFSGTVEDGINDLMSNLGLSTLFAAGTCPATNVTVQYSRYARGWDALRELLSAASLRPSLRCVPESGSLVVYIDAESPRTLGEEVDGDTSDMSMVCVFTSYNHLIALGQGELAARDVYECFADASGNVSTTQSITGLAERVYLYDYPSAEHDELVAEATKQLQELQSQGEVEVALPQGANVCIGDYAAAYDARIDASVTAMVTGCVVKVSDGAAVVQWKAE